MSVEVLFYRSEAISAAATPQQRRCLLRANLPEAPRVGDFLWLQDRAGVGGLKVVKRRWVEMMYRTTYRPTHTVWTCEVYLDEVEGWE